MLRRYALLSSVSLFGAALAPSAFAKPKFGFKEAALAMSATALGMAAFVSALQQANKSGQSRLSPMQAQDAAQLLKLHKAVTELVAVQRYVTLKEMQKYGDGPMPSEWPDVQERLGKTVDAIDKINALFDQQINSFIRSDLYPAFKGNFAERAALLRQIQALPSPQSQKDVGYFRDLVSHYRELLVAVDALGKELQTMIPVASPPVLGAPPAGAGAATGAAGAVTR